MPIHTRIVKVEGIVENVCVKLPLAGGLESVSLKRIRDLHHERHRKRVDLRGLPHRPVLCAGLGRVVCRLAGASFVAMYQFGTIGRNK